MSKKRHKKRFRVFVFLRLHWRQLSRDLVTGILVWVPLIITIWASWLFVTTPVLGLESLIKSLVATLHNLGERYPVLSFLSIVRYRFGSGFLIAIALFWTTGFLTRYLIGRKIIGYGERILNQIPLVSRVYRATRQIRDAFVGRKGAIFQKACLIEYPRPGMVAMAFVMSAEEGIVQHTSGKNLVAVFVPTTPNPTSGYLVYLPPEDITEVDISVEEAMKLIVSGGAYLPGESIMSGDEQSPARKQAAPPPSPKQEQTP